MFKARIMPTVAALIAAFVMIGVFPRRLLEPLNVSDEVKGLIVIGLAIAVAWLVERLLKTKK